MKQLIFVLLMISPLVTSAQADSVSLIGVINNISINSGGAHNDRFEVKVKVFTVISGKADSTVVFYIHSPAKQLFITDYEKPGTFRDNVFYFSLNKIDGKIILIGASLGNVIKEVCPKCNKPLQGFMFGNDFFSHNIYCCPQHGEMNEEWEDYEKK